MCIYIYANPYIVYQYIYILNTIETYITIMDTLQTYKKIWFSPCRSMAPQVPWNRRLGVGKWRSQRRKKSGAAEQIMVFMDTL